MDIRSRIQVNKLASDHNSESPRLEKHMCRSIRHCDYHNVHHHHHPSARLVKNVQIAVRHVIFGPIGRRTAVCVQFRAQTLGCYDSKGRLTRGDMLQGHVAGKNFMRCSHEGACCGDRFLGSVHTEGLVAGTCRDFAGTSPHDMSPRVSRP